MCYFTHNITKSGEEKPRSISVESDVSFVTFTYLHVKMSACLTWEVLKGTAEIYFITLN